MAQKKLNIKKAVKRPGRMQKWCKAHGFSSVTCACLDKAKASASKRGDKSLMSAVNLAKRFKGCGGMKLRKGGKKRGRK